MKEIEMKDVINAYNRSKYSEEKIEIYVKKMNYHLQMLHQSLKDGDEEQIEFQKNELERVRRILFELEYFTL